MVNLIGMLDEEQTPMHAPSYRRLRSMDTRALDFRVAHELSKFELGAMSISKLLLRSRGLVQSWLKMGEEHPLASSKVDGTMIKKKVLKLKRKSTFQNLDYFVARRLFKFDLSSSFIANVLGLPTSTVNSWRNDNVPLNVRDGFMDEELVEAKFQSVMDEVRREVTIQNLPYLLAVEISRRTKEEQGRGIGGRAIGNLLSDYLGVPKIPERTISSWISGERVPHNIVDDMVDKAAIERRYLDLRREVTRKNIHYHVAMTLHEKRGWGYGALALLLHQDKEKVRGWIRKSRGSTVAKRLVDQGYVDNVIEHICRGGIPDDDIVSTTLENLSRSGLV